jgi:S-(hydroxymethyl)glutathione dehydrogenase/alcohol dehydrogenase
MAIRAKAAIFEAVNKPLIIDEVQLDGPGDGEVLIEIKASGICHSDLHMLDGKVPCSGPAILGHEAGGIVVECGPGVRSLKPGDHVIPLFSPECHECPSCMSGRTNMCEKVATGVAPGSFSWNGKRVSQALFSAFSNYTNVPEYAAAKIRPDAPLDKVFYIGCGVTTGVGAAIFTADVQPGSSVIVFGLGGIGLNIIQGARLAGASRIIGIDINPKREAIARRFGATEFVNPKTVTGDLAGHLRELTSGGADYAFEAIGTIQLIEQAIESTRPFWGTTVLVGLPPMGESLSVNPWDYLFGRRLIGTWFGGAKGRSDVPKIVDLYMEKKIDIDELVTHKLSLEQINEGFDLMRNGESIRSVITF